jgi:hypothetical protein
VLTAFGLETLSNGRVASLPDRRCTGRTDVTGQPRSWPATIATDRPADETTHATGKPTKKMCTMIIAMVNVNGGVRGPTGNRDSGSTIQFITV